MARAKSADPSPDHDLLNQVHGLVRVYDCPDTASVDNYLCELRVRIQRAHSLPKLLAQYRADSDSLLDHRLWLEMTGEPRASKQDRSTPEVRTSARRPSHT